MSQQDAPRPPQRSQLPARGQSWGKPRRAGRGRAAPPSLTWSAAGAPGRGQQGGGQAGQGQQPALGHGPGRRAPGARTGGAPLPAAFSWCVFYLGLLHLSHSQQEERLCRGLTQPDPAQGAQTGACPIQGRALTGTAPPGPLPAASRGNTIDLQLLKTPLRPGPSRPPSSPAQPGRGVAGTAGLSGHAAGSQGTK